MSEYYTRKEIQNLFNPPLSKHYLRCLENKNRMPKPVKKTHCGYVYDKKQIDDWLSQGVEKDKCGMKAGERQTRMLNDDFDAWNLRKNKEPIKYTGLMVDVIKFLQPNLRHKEISNL